MRVVRVSVQTVSNRELATGSRRGPPSFSTVLYGPPCFTGSLGDPSTTHAVTHRASALAFSRLTRDTSHLLDPGNRLSMIVPCSHTGSVAIDTTYFNLFAAQRAVVYPIRKTGPGHVLVTFSQRKTPRAPRFLYVRSTRERCAPRCVHVIRSFCLGVWIVSYSYGPP